MVSYKCPNCGGPLNYDIETQKWACRFCLGSFDLSALKGHEDLPEASGVSSGGFGGAEAVQEFVCPSCGGAIVSDQQTVATYCVYCKNPTILAGRLQDGERPEWILPFRITKEGVTEILEKAMKNRPLMPKVFRETLGEGEVNGLYVPYWLYDLHLESQITGQGKRVSSWQDQKYRYTKTDVFHVERGGAVRYRHVPADASKRLDDRSMQNIEPFDEQAMVDFDMRYLSGHFAERYDIKAEEAFPAVYQRVTEAWEQEMIRDTTYSSFQIRSRNHRYRERQNHYAMMPVWIFSVKYRDKLYRFLVNGQTGKLTGKLPVDGRKLGIWLVGSFLGAWGLLSLLLSLFSM